MEIGDVVQLKSGGPYLTIERVDVFDCETVLTCSWFNNNNEYKVVEFDSRTVTFKDK